MLLASEKELDLVMVNKFNNPAVAKLINYTKEIYRQQKARRKQKVKHNIELKEIVLSINIDKHDLETKARRAKEFLSKKNKVKIVISLRGREMLFQDKAKKIIENFVLLVNADYEQAIKREGKRYYAIIAAKK